MNIKLKYALTFLIGAITGANIIIMFAIPKSGITEYCDPNGQLVTTIINSDGKPISSIRELNPKCQNDK